MGIEMIDVTTDVKAGYLDGLINPIYNSCNDDIDARRRLEDKMEEMKLRREMREFDFDFEL